MTTSAHKTALPNRPQTMRFRGSVFTGKERDEETGYGYFGARYMDHELTAMWLSVDPMADKYPSISPYAYCAWNPVKLTDPDGNSPISALAKLAAKQGIKKSIKIYAKKNIENRLKAYMNKNIAKQFVKDLDDVISTLDNSWWETGIELIPVVGDLYGGTKFGIKIAKAYDKLQNLENKYVEKIYKSLPKSEREKFKKAMRDAGVRDARRDQREGVESLGETYVKGRQIDGHHKKPVSEDISQSSDPRNIEFMPKEKHRQVHSNNNY